MAKENVRYRYIMEYKFLNHEKEGNSVICNTMDRIMICVSEISQRKTMYCFIYTWNLEGLIETGSKMVGA